ncbi:MAG: DEAD/DEAH box helicase [Puniceicoccales bacterium]|jgi:superfamily II DNA/RNA helicase|nr:DEAD/DEAH box helicase [Puniceicoccales bacterium]
MENNNCTSSEDNGFEAFGLADNILETLKSLNFSTPTDIQKLAIPAILKGRDVLATAQTGTGKTAAFGLPIVEKIYKNRDHGALIMTPTRELAVQVYRAITSFMGKSTSIATALLIGGESYDRQLRQLRKHPSIIVGTPGRINDHLLRKSLSLSHVRYLVLDETDRMLDMGFGVQIEEILRFLPEAHQTMLFSATLPKEILRLSQQYLNNAERIVSGELNRPIEAIKQEIINVSDAEKYDELIRQLCARDGSVIIFVKTRRDADFIARRLTKDAYSALAIHGNLQQRQRSRVILNFREKKCRILVATDVAARGLDIPHIEHVINYDLPQCPEDYVHRIGRTARAGASGSSLCLICPGDRRKWYAIDRMMNPEKCESRGHDRVGFYPRGRSSGGNRNFRSQEKRRDFHRSEDFHGVKRDGMRSVGRARRSYSSDRSFGRASAF